MSIEIDTERGFLTVNGRQISFLLLETMVEPLNLYGAGLTIQSLEWIIRELQARGSVVVANCGIPNEPSGLLQLGAELAEMARASTHQSEPAARRREG